MDILKPDVMHQDKDVEEILLNSHLLALKVVIHILKNSKGAMSRLDLDEVFDILFDLLCLEKENSPHQRCCNKAIKKHNWNKDAVNFTTQLLTGKVFEVYDDSLYFIS